MVVAGDLFSSLNALVAVGLDVVVGGGAVKGTIVGGAVSLCCRPDNESVEPLVVEPGSFKQLQVQRLCPWPWC